jgi:hypothetical protein
MSKNKRTLEKIREQERIRRKRYYEKHKEKVKKDNRERYHRKKLDKELSEVQERIDIQI